MAHGFELHLQSAARVEIIAGVVSFVGNDSSGSFGILPGRAPFMTLLEYGLARYRTTGSAWHYLACPGGVLVFADNRLFLATRRYLQDDDYERVSAVLAGQLAREEAALATLKENLRQLEQELMIRLQKLGHRPA